MERFSIHAYEGGYAEAAAGLLAAARAARRWAFPALGSGLDDAAQARSLVDACAGGSVAMDGRGNLAAFLFAERRDDPIWGTAIEAGIDRWTFAAPSAAAAPGASPHAAAALPWLYAAAFAAADGAAPGGAAPSGAAPGRAPEHRVFCSAANGEALRAWFGLGFGMEQAYAAARLDDLDALRETPRGVEIRRAEPGDGEALAELSPLIATMQAGPPVWAGAPPEYLADIREGYRGLAADGEAIVLMAFRGARALGFQAWFPMEESAADGVPAGAAELSVAATVPEERGRGLGLALTARGIDEARGAGFSTAFTDWRTTNPLSSAFWAARGFKPYMYRLARRLDPRALSFRR